MTLIAGCAAGQEVPGRIGLPYDWSHHHVVFSQSDSSERLEQMQSDPRYWQQIYRNLYQQHSETRPRRSAAASPDNVDWSESLSTSPLDVSPRSYPAKYSFDVADPTPDCANDYVVLTLRGVDNNRANIVAFNNLYVNATGTGTCAGTVPTPIFTYNVSQNQGSIDSAPALSLDGTQIAFIEDAGSAQFHVLKWTSGNVAATFGQAWNSSALPDCSLNGAVAPCEYNTVYSIRAATHSSAYVDYASDTAYVSDDGGAITAISPVFGGGTPEVVYSVKVSPGSIMAPPIYDSVSGNVFAATDDGVLYYLRTSATSSGSCASGVPPCVGSPSLRVGNGDSIVDAPLVDSTNGTVFMFSSTSPGSLIPAVIQTTTTLSTSRVADVGSTATLTPLDTGIFNNAYYNNPGSGLLYVCGRGAGNVQELYGISFTGTQMNTGTPAFGPLALSTEAGECSPMTEVYNQSTSRDYIFVGIENGCSDLISGGCLEEFDVTNGFPTAAAAAVAESGGTTGIVIDNVSNGSSGNASQTNLYFGTLGAQSCSEYTGGTTSAGNCLVKLTQTGLQ